MASSCQAPRLPGRVRGERARAALKALPERPLGILENGTA